MITIKINNKDFKVDFVEKKTIYEYLKDLMKSKAIENTNFTINKEPLSLAIKDGITISLETKTGPCWFF